MAISDWEDGASIKVMGGRGFVGKTRVLLTMSIRPPNDLADAGESGARGEARLERAIWGHMINYI